MHNDRSPDRRLRVGYVSPDFRDHPVGRFMLPRAGTSRSHRVGGLLLLQMSAAAMPSPNACANMPTSGATSSGFPISRSPDLVRQDRIDILVDLAMHTANNRLLVFARKPAPVQVTWLGYPGTTGLTTIDYRLTDP